MFYYTLWALCLILFIIFSGFIILFIVHAYDYNKQKKFLSNIFTKFLIGGKVESIETQKVVFIRKNLFEDNSVNKLVLSYEKYREYYIFDLTLDGVSTEFLILKNDSLNLKNMVKDIIFNFTENPLQFNNCLITKDFIKKYIV